MSVRLGCPSETAACTGPSCVGQAIASRYLAYCSRGRVIASDRRSTASSQTASDRKSTGSFIFCPAFLSSLSSSVPDNYGCAQLDLIQEEISGKRSGGYRLVASVHRSSVSVRDASTLQQLVTVSPVRRGRSGQTETWTSTSDHH